MTEPLSRGDFYHNQVIEGMQGGIGGATSGAAIGGMVGGPFGSLIGAGIGGLTGVLSTSPWEKYKKPSEKLPEFARTVSAYDTGGTVTGTYGKEAENLEGTDGGGFVATRESPMLNQEPYNEDFSF